MQRSSVEGTSIKLLLNKHGLRSTYARELILRTLIQAHIPMSLEELHTDPRIHDQLSYATVYRTLQLFCEHGLIVSLMNLKGQHKYFTREVDHKHYLTCTSCDKQIEIESCSSHLLEKQLAQSTGFMIIGHAHEYYGLCPDCQTRIDTTSLRPNS